MFLLEKEQVLQQRDPRFYTNSLNKIEVDFGHVNRIEVYGIGLARSSRWLLLLLPSSSQHGGENGSQRTA
jgi:hypothetical protein